MFDRPGSDDSACLPDYRLRISTRARRVLIKVNPAGRVEVVVPQGFDVRAIPDILRQRQGWIQATREKVARQSRSQPETHALVPRRIELAAIDEHWQLHGAASQKRLLVAEPQRRILKIKQGTSDSEIARELRNWLQRRARRVLPEWLRQVSEQYDLPCQRISVRGQKTRWGSCSTQSNINLNRNLLFLPADTVHYLFVHELCHTLYMNHSADFWREVAARVPDYRHHDRLLGRHAGRLPLWVYA